MRRQRRRERICRLLTAQTGRTEHKPGVRRLAHISWQPIILILSLSLVVSFPCQAGESPEESTPDTACQWRIFTTDNSRLTSNSVWATLQDHEDVLWFGTGGGVSYYDPSVGILQTLNTANSGLANDWVAAILQDNNGALWFGTSGGGVSRYADGQWQTFNTENSGLVDDSVWSILQDDDGAFWFGTLKGGVSRYNDDQWQTFNTENSGLASDYVRTILQDRDGALWFGTWEGASRYADGQWQTFNTENSALEDDRVQAILEGRDGALWFGTDGGGVSWYADDQWQTFNTENSGLAGNQVPAILQDRDGALWFGTWGKGVSRYAESRWQTFNTENSGLAHDYVPTILQDHDDALWFGTSGGGVCHCAKDQWRVFDAGNSGLAGNQVAAILQDRDGTFWFGTLESGVSRYAEGQWQTFNTQNSGLAGNQMAAILQDRDGALWFGTDGGGVSRYAEGQWQTFNTENSGLAGNQVAAILQDRDGALWFSAWGRGVSRYAESRWQNFNTENSGLTGDNVRSILQDRDGALWFGTDAGGVSRYAEGQWQTFNTQNSAVVDDRIWTIFQGNDGALWLGTDAGGVSRYAEGQWQTFNTQNSGLAGNQVLAILQDRDGVLWFGTWGGGVSRYAYGQWQTFDTQNSGLANNLVRAMLQDHDGALWFSTQGKGVEQRVAGRKHPWVLLRTLYVGRENQTSDQALLAPRASIALDYTDNTFTIGFIGADPESRPSSIRYRCRLEGYEEQWFNTAGNGVRYSNMPPGHYTFVVQAIDEDGLLSQPATLDIAITSPFWRTPWFLGLGALILIAGGITSVNGVRRYRHARRLAAWRKGADPYIVGDVVEEPERFYGREKALTELLHALEAGNHIPLYGERRIGKTSLLHQLAHRLRKQPHPEVYFLPVFVSLQMVLESRFFYALANATGRAAARDLEQKTHDHPPLRMDGRPEGYDSLDLADDLEAIVRALQEAKGRSPCIVLLLDEADKMNGYKPQTQEALRGLLMTPVGGHVKLVWSGQTMNREWHLESSPWYNLFKREIHLGSMEEESAVRLIREPVKGVFTYDDEAIQRILELTSREPYPIQRLCSLCVRRMLRENRFRITIDDVSAAWQELQAEDTRRAAEGATEPGHRAPRQVWAVAEDGTEYHTDEENEP